MSSQAGWEREFTAFCDGLQPRLLRSIALYVGDPCVAEELVQEALYRSWVHWGRLRAMDAPSMWTYRSAMNLSKSWFRRRLAEQRALRRTDDVEAPRWSDAVTVELLSLRAAIAGLAPRQRTALILRSYADLSVDQTAFVMGCAPGTVKALTHQAMRRLKQVLNDEDETEIDS
jgi:RNA polymerase sigma-70 factor (sigma-E family)